MTVANDLSVPVNVVAGDGNHLGRQRHIAIGQADTIKSQLEVTLAPEVARVLVGFQMSYDVATARENRLAKLLHGPRVAKKWIADTHCGGREPGLVKRARH
jgi:hypothetical protein